MHLQIWQVLGAVKFYPADASELEPPRPDQEVNRGQSGTVGVSHGPRGCRRKARVKYCETEKGPFGLWTLIAEERFFRRGLFWNAYIASPALARID